MSALLSRNNDRPIDGEEAAALRAVLPMLVYAPVPAERADVERMIGKAVLAYPAGRLSDGEAELRLAVYADALEDLPADVLGHAFQTAIRTMRFFPTVAELRVIAEGELARRRWWGRRAAYLLAQHARDWRPPHGAASDEAERAAIGRQMAEFRRCLDAGEPYDIDAASGTGGAGENSAASGRDTAP